MPFYGFAVMCIDHPRCRSWSARSKDRRVITYGENPQADFGLLDLRYENAVTKFSVRIRDRLTAATHDIAGLACRCRATTTC